MEEVEEKESKRSQIQKYDGRLGRVANWVDSRLGLSYPMLRPVPQYAINPFYWLGALAVVAFVIQAITGIIMMLYYVPSPTGAYSSTLYIFNNVSFGTFLETVHLYTAYAMIMLVFMHLMRGYFVSVQKKPREAMWIVGMLMGFVTLGFGFTGYLLPWTVVSKSATDVGVGMVSALPPPLSSFLTFLIVGSGSDANVLLRFYDLHVVVLPAALLILLAVKMYMLESHGVSEPVTEKGIEDKKSKKSWLVPVFPDASFYIFELAALFGTAMLLVSIFFPLTLPPQFTPQLASQYVSQPDWYFLWIYQILKISVFEGQGLPVALGLVTVIFVALFLLPFIDGRVEERRISKRSKYMTIGSIFVAELVVLTFWGLITPGKIIPAEQATLVLGGTALLVALVSFSLYRLAYGKVKKVLPTLDISTPIHGSVRKAQLTTGSVFAILAGLGALFIGTSIDAMTRILVLGSNASSLIYLLSSLAALSATIFATVYVLYRADMHTGAIRRRVGLLEVGQK